MTVNPKTRFHSVPPAHRDVRQIIVAVLLLISSMTVVAQEYTRGVGLYPGDPKEDFAPSMRTNRIHRNLALHRAAYQSSSYDFNLTAQLVTDGIKETQPPGWLVVTTSDGGILRRNERQWVIDRNAMTRKKIVGSSGWLQVELAGGSAAPEVDSINVEGNLFVDSLPARPWQISAAGSDDGRRWEQIGEVHGDSLPGDTLTGWWRTYYPRNLRAFNFSMKPGASVRYQYYRLTFNSPNAESWNIGEFGLSNAGRRTQIGGPYEFSSGWMSAGAKEEWVYVDLGARCSIDRVVLSWIQKASEGSIQVSEDAQAWKTIAPLPAGTERTDEVALHDPAEGRYVRVLMTKTSFDHYILSELEVYGTGGPVPVAHPRAAMVEEDKAELSGGAWKIQRASLVHGDGAALSKPGFDDSGWIVATVPGTVLVSYLNAGALPDPNFSDNQLLISDSYFYSDFWYRDEFTPPRSFDRKRTFLNFNGINWKADVFLNGGRLGSIEGAFTRKRFDVTNIILPGKINVVAVLIRKNDTPGFVKEQTMLSHDVNGGELGSDNPTFHASVGWDWIPTIRGRNTGIWKDVYLSAAGPVTIDDPFVSTTLPLPDTTSADVDLEVTLVNHTSKPVAGTLVGTFGMVQFEQEVSLARLEEKTVRLDPGAHPSLRLKNPRLWWPNGYGDQYLYKVGLKFKTKDGKVSDSKTFRTGVRQMTYSEAGGKLKIWVNGRRFVGRGGNWGFSESMLRYRAREYDIAVRYHKEMNFTMIRNWVGQTGDDEFYDACDKYGIMVWQDFWLANPLDGPEPSDNGMFMQNVKDFVRRIRNHPSIGLYCGRNEGNPPEPIDSAIRIILPQLHPGLHYISNSASGVVSGGGPYRAMPVKFYFEQRATERLHSEIGMPNMVSYESLRRMIPDSSLWPINRLWGVHDFNLESAQYGSSFIQLMTDHFGPIDSLKDWLQLAQWINYQGYRAMFEAQSKNRMGLLLWMSHPAWPSMVWQTYDYFFEPTAAYFGCKKACEPLHIQWNALTDSIEVVNYSDQRGTGLAATMDIFKLDGTLRLERTVNLDCPEDCTVRPFPIGPPDSASSVDLIRLKLMRNGAVVSENEYWRGAKKDDLTPLRHLPSAEVGCTTKAVRDGSTWRLVTELANSTGHIVPMIKLTVLGEKSRERILPVIFSDNYVSLLPGERRKISIELENVDTRGEMPVVTLEGYHVE